MAAIRARSIDLVVTSPPYPMIEMWDPPFSKMNIEIGEAIDRMDGTLAFDLMIQELNMVWKEISRVTRNGGIVCINIGDATRNLGGRFRLYPSHTAVSRFFRKNGFDELPSIIWKKPANSPNKFLGSGTLPVNAYVTLEHEYILIFRKTPMRKFSGEDQTERRQKSAFFWEERNLWFSDVWEKLVGTRQRIEPYGDRARSGAFPLELPMRLINMYSIQGDTVLDPFSGTGTTSRAAAASGRNSVGYEIESELNRTAESGLLNSMEELNVLIRKRIDDHSDFVGREVKNGRVFAHFNNHHGFPVMTKSERGIVLREIETISRSGPSNGITVSYL